MNREYAVNLLRSAAATNQVRFRVKHFHPSLSSVEYQKLLYDDKSTDDDEENPRSHNISQNKNDNNHTSLTTNEGHVRKSARKHHRARQAEQSYGIQTYNVAYESSKREQEQDTTRLDLSPDAQQALLNSRFKLIDLVDLLKKLYPKLFSNDQKRELQFVEQLSETNTGKRALLEYESILSPDWHNSSHIR